MAEREIVFQLSQLSIGRPLRFDVRKTDGDLLARSGELITQEMLDRWTTEGVTTAVATVDDDGTTATSNPKWPVEEPAKRKPDEQQLLEPYDEAALLRLENCFQNATRATREIVKLLESNAPPNCELATSVIENFVAEAQLDIATVLASLSLNDAQAPSEKDEMLSARSAQMAALSVVICTSSGYSDADCQTVGLAGMLHDLSLYDQAESTVSLSYGKPKAREQHYLDHPLQSATLLTYVPGISDLTRQLITQVHEQPDGFGFPRGLLEHRIHRLAKVLHVVDAYLTLIAENQPEPLPRGSALVPADAIAYILRHAGMGHFDVEATRGLVHATSLYPVGSLVELNDLSTARVLRSSPISPSEPIVRLDAGVGRIVDIRNSNLSITRPIPPSGSNAKRLQPSKLNEVLWR